MAFSGMSSSDGDENIVAEINVTPLVDVMLVLLIIFMVSSSVMSQMGMDVDIPTASQAVSKEQPEGVTLTLLPDGRMQVNTEVVDAGDWAVLKDRLASAFAVSESRLLILEGDKKAFLGNAVKVMDSASQVGAQQFAIATSLEEASQ